MTPLVLDTNVVLDLLVFDDAACAPLNAALEASRLHWLATDAMHDEFARVLGYPKLAARLAARGHRPDALLAAYERRSRRVASAAKAPVTCGDPDDQKFIDLAVAHQALLLSKDFEVLRMRKRLAALRVHAAAVLPA